MFIILQCTLAQFVATTLISLHAGTVKVTSVPIVRVKEQFVKSGYTLGVD